MNRIFKFAVVMTAALASFAGCSEKVEEEKKPQLTEELEFTLELNTVSHNEAAIKVEHNGTAEDSWYGFITSETIETEDDLNKVIATEIQRLLTSGNIAKKVSNETKTISIMRGLSERTIYTYIVIGLTKDGNIYGNKRGIMFRTPIDISKIKETEDWKIIYERGVNNGVDAELFTINCENNKGWYFSYIDKYSLEVEELDVKDYIQYVIEQEVPSLIEMGYSWSKDLYMEGTETIAYPRIIHGDYIGVAIGYTADGEPTGEYSQVEFTVVEEEVTPEYQKWIGQWDVTSTFDILLEEGGTPVQREATYHISLHHIDNNFLYAMTGWEEVDNEDEYYYHIGNYTGSTFQVPVYFNDGKLDFVETGLTYLYDSSTGAPYYFGFWGMGDVSSGSESHQGTLIASEGTSMAEGIIFEDGQTGVINGLTQRMVQGTSSTTIEYLGMFFCAYPLQSGGLFYVNTPMEFPIDMTKISDEPVLPDFEPEAMSVVKKEKNGEFKSDRVKKAEQIKKGFTPRYL